MTGSAEGARTSDHAEHLLRELAPQVLGAVVRRYRDFAAGEDAVQEALLAAAVQWPRDGVPDNPRGWLIQVASRRMADHLRSETARRRRETLAAAESEPVVPLPPATPAPAQDDTLVLLFMCCHPALTTASAIALTLRAVGGLTTAEIAARLPRARGDHGAADQPRQAERQDLRRPLPPPRRSESGPTRLGAVLHVLYLIFNEGYTTSGGPALHPHRPVAGGDPADPPGAPAAPGRRRGRPGCWR